MFSVRKCALFGCASARLPIRTLASEYALVAVLWNTSLVSLGDLEDLQTIVLRQYFVFGYIAIPNRPPATSMSCGLRQDSRMTDFPRLIFGTKKGVRRV